MTKKEQKELLLAMEVILKQNNLSKNELVVGLKEVFEKTFGKDFSILGEIDKESIPLIENAIIEAKIDFENFEFNVYRIWKINNGTIEPENLFRETNIDSEIVTDKTLKEGDTFTEEIDLSKITNSKRQQVYQLLVQKLKESEKEKVFLKFNKLLNTIVVAKVSKIMDKFVLLEYMDETIFLHRNEFSRNDRFRMGELKKVLIFDINRTDRESQIIGTRSRAKFVEELIKLENDYVKNGTIEIREISREPGVKTKIAVSSNNDLVDPVGSIIGVRGSKIKEIIAEINGEIIDVVQHNDDPKLLINNLFHPAKVKGIYIDENNNYAAILVDSNDFLQAIGKRGVNVKLVAQIMNFKIDVVTEDRRGDFNFEFEPISQSNMNKYKNNKPSNEFRLEIKTLDELIEEGNKLEENYDDGEF